MYEDSKVCMYTFKQFISMWMIKLISLDCIVWVLEEKTPQETKKYDKVKKVDMKVTSCFTFNIENDYNGLSVGVQMIQSRG